MKDKRKIVGSIFLSLVLATAIACSSNDKKDESSAADVADATTDTGAPPEGGDQAAPPADGAQASADQANPDQAAPPPDQAQASNGDQPPADPNAAPPATSDADAAALDAPPAAADGSAPAEVKEGDMASAEQPPADPNSPPPGADATTPPPADNPAPADTTASAPPPDASATGGDAFGAAAAADAAPKKHSAPLAHIKDAPFTRGGQNLNTVYIARDGDTMDSISQKLFGEDKTKMLKKGNPSLKKNVKTGDKVYFNSPNRPDDKEKMMTVYEDQGLPPSTYTTKDGDTLKSLAQEWYGSEGSYKEIYAINKNLTSTKELPAGTDLQYWPSSVNVSAYSAKKENEVAAAAPPAPPANPPPGQNPPGAPPGMPPGGAPGQPGMPGNNMAMNNPPGQNPPGMPGAPGAPGMPGNGMPPAAGMTDPNAPGGPGLGAPPAPPPMQRKPPKDLSASQGMDKDTFFYAGVAGILLVASALWFALRRRRSRNGGVTQI